MALSNLQKGLWSHPSILWCMWDLLAPLCGSHLPTTGATAQAVENSSVELHLRLDSADLGRSVLGPGPRSWIPMDNISQTQNVIPQKAITKSEQIRPGAPQRAQRQGKRLQCGDRETGTTCLTNQCCGATLVDLHEHHCSCHAAAHATSRRRQAAQDHHGSIEEAQRCTATGNPVNGERGSHQGGTAADQAASRCGSRTRQSPQRVATGTTCQIPSPQCVEGILEPSRGSVAGLQFTVLRAREADERESQYCHGCTGAGQGQLGQSQIHGRDRAEGGHHGNQRRGGGQGDRRKHCRSDQRRSLKPPKQPGSATELCGADGRRRTESTQTSTHRRSPTGWRRQAIDAIWCCYGVWLGRVNRDLVTIAHRPLDTHVADSLILKWSHSVQFEHNFVSEWQAQDNAFHLAQELSILQPQCLTPGSFVGSHVDGVNQYPAVLRHTLPQSPMEVHEVSPKRLLKSAAFSSTVSVRIGEDTSDAFLDFVMHFEGLQSILKPWSLFEADGQKQSDRHHTSRRHVRHDMHHTNSYERDANATWPPVPVPRCTPIHNTIVQLSPMPYGVNPHVEQPSTDVQRVSGTDNAVQTRTESVATEDNIRSCIMHPQPLSEHACCVDPQTVPDCTIHVDRFQCCNELTVFTQNMHDIMESLPDLSYIRSTAHAFRQPKTCQDADALLKAAPACRTATNRVVKPMKLANRSALTHARHDILHVHILHAPKRLPGPPVLQTRREHESPIAHLREGPDNDEDDADENMEAHDHPILPAFVNFLANRLESMGLNPHDNDFDIAVRTWYIDHRTVHRWTAPRILQLVGPPRGWEAQVQSLWTDQLNDADWFDAILVEPDPPRPSRHAFVVYDLIITQSLEIPRVAALITVMPGRADTFQMYSVACSLPERVSGYELVQAADANQICRYSECLITYRWVQIPHTLRPVHLVGHGDGFQIAVHDRNGPTQHNRAEDASSSDAITASPTYSPGRPCPAASSSQPVPFMTTLHLFQMDGIEVCTTMVNNQRIQPTQELADALNVPLDCLEAIHIIPQIPFQMPEYEVAAVAQRTGDVAVHNSSSCLLRLCIITAA